MKKLVLCFLVLFVGACKTTNSKTIAANTPNVNRHPAAGDSNSTVSSQDASKLMKLARKLNAIEPSNDPCGMGSCYENATLMISCRTVEGANGKRKPALTHCEVSNTKKGAKSKGFNGHAAARMLSALIDANAVEHNSCQNRRCHYRGRVSLNCQSPNGPHDASETSCSAFAEYHQPVSGAVAPSETPSDAGDTHTQQ